MNAVSAKPRRRMRVATIFTGVAAATIGMTQVANAQAIHPANAQDHRPTNMRGIRGMRPAGRLSGSIRSSIDCTGNAKEPHWLHISTTYVTPPINSSHVVSDCFGFKGYYESPPGIGAFAECGGTNHGYLYGSKGSHSTSFAYGPGTTYHALGWSHLYVVIIKSWTGNDACPEAPRLGQPG
jgi:hypothetical protein